MVVGYLLIFLLHKKTSFCVILPSENRFLPLKRLEKVARLSKHHFWEVYFWWPKWHFRCEKRQKNLYSKTRLHALQSLKSVLQLVQVACKVFKVPCKLPKLACKPFKVSCNSSKWLARSLKSLASYLNWLASPQKWLATRPSGLQDL